MKRPALRETSRALAATLAITLTGALTVTRTAARAAGTQVWEVRTTAEFAEGKLDGVIVTSLPSGGGELRTGWMLDKVKVEADAVWCILPDGEGGALVGTGNKGELFRLKDGKVERVGETKAVAVTVLRRGPDGGVLVGTAPDGCVFVRKDGKLAELVKLEAKYVWDLAVAPDGSVYAATGPEGKLFRIEGKQAELWFKSKEPNLVSLALDDNDVVYAGSGEKGLLYRITGKDKATVAYDFGENEVRAILVREKGLVIAANSAKSKGGAPSAPQAAPGDGGGKPGAGGNAKGNSPSMPSKEPMDCAVYRLSRDGAVEPAFSSKGEFIWNLAQLADGTVLAGTGEKGRVYRIRTPSVKGEPVFEDGGADVLFDLEEAQALALGVEFGRLGFLGTGNGAAVYRADAQVPGKGLYESKVLDAKFVASWGRIEWDGKGEFELRTRSGATAEPDGTWHPWAEVEPERPFALSPRARYLQFAASLKGRDAVLRSVRVAYLPDNQRPHIESVAVDGQGGGGKPNAQGGKPPEQAAAGASPAPKHTTSRTVAWKAADPDGDGLRFLLSCKLEKDPDDFFRPMNARGESGYNEPVTGDKFAWETHGLPDGRYVVRVIASDEGANPESRARSAAKDSEPFLVDHTPPAIVGLAVKGGEIAGIARDTASRITYLAWTLDGGKTRILAPEDGIFDAREERMRVKLPEGLAEGPHAVAVQAADEAGNLRTVRLTFLVE